MKNGWSKRLAYIVIALGLASGVAGAVAAFRSAIPFGTASSWSSAVQGDPNATQGPWFNTAGHAFVHGQGVNVGSNIDYELDTIPFSIMAYGGTGNGVADESTPLANALSAASAVSGTVVLPKGSYFLASTFNWTYSNVNLIGQSSTGGAAGVTITCPQITCIKFTSTSSISNVTIQGIKIVSTFVQVADPVLGIVNAQSDTGTDFSMDNINFVDVEVTGSTGGAGLKFVPQSPTSKQFTNITILRPYLHDLGREGITVQNHGPGNVSDSVVRYQNVIIRNGRFVNLGLNGYAGTGLGISIDGPGTNAVVDDNLFSNCESIGVEYVNTSGQGQISRNRFRDFQVRNGVPYDPVSIDTILATSGPAFIVTDNQELDTPPASSVSWNFFHMDRGVVANNVTRGMGFVVTNTTNTIFEGNQVNSLGSYGIYVSGTSTGNRIIGNFLSNTVAASPFSVLRYDGAAVTNNEATNNTINFVGGVSNDQINGAANNYFGTQYINSTETIDPSIVTLARLQALSQNPSVDATAALNLGTSTATSVSAGNTANTTFISLRTTSTGFVQYAPGSSGNFVIGGTAATGGTTTVNSPSLTLGRGAHWNGASSVNDNAVGVTIVESTTPTSYWSLSVGGTEVERFTSGGLTTSRVGGAISSATTIAPTAKVSHITGTTTIQTITAPAECAATSTGCTIVLVFDGVAPWNAAGNIFVAGTPTTAGTFVEFTFDNGTSKWYPSRTL